MKTPTAAENRQPAWLTVALREVTVKVTDKAFIIGTLSTLAMVVLAMVASFYFTSRPTTTTVAVTSPQAAAVAEAVGQLTQAEKAEDKVVVQQVPDAAAATELVANGDAGVFLDHREAGWVTVWKSEVGSNFERRLGMALTSQTIAELAVKAGTTPEAATAQMSWSTELLEGDTSQGMLAYFAGIGFALLFMMSSMIYGMQIATSVIEEKQSRIVEILVSVIPVRQLLAGKVAGNTLIAFAQMVLLLGVGLIGLSISPFNRFLPNFSNAIGWFLLFFLAGFLALACIWAAAGALGTRSEDLNQTSSPLMWVIMLTYMAGFTASGVVKVILSFVPIVSSVLMPVRLVEGTTSWWEPPLALLINLAFAVAMVLVGERIYRRSLMRTGGRLSWRQALTLKD